MKKQFFLILILSLQVSCQGQVVNMDEKKIENIIRPIVEKVAKQDWKNAKLDFLGEDSFSEFSLYITNNNDKVFELSPIDYEFGIYEMNALNSFIKENCKKESCNKIIITLTPNSFSYELMFLKEKNEHSERMKAYNKKEEENTLKTTLTKSKLELIRYRKIESMPENSKRIKSLPIEALTFSEFYVRLYSLFGEPSDIGFEGFTYIILDSIENKTFSPSLTSVGAGYYAEDDSDDSQKMIKHFHDMLYSEELKLKECKLKYNSDFGKVTLGYSKGKFFYTEGNFKLEK
jgi:hypothetical protein